MMRVINVSDLTVVSDGKIILDNISFEVEVGSFVSIIGNNGSGKSMLIRSLTGFQKFNGYIDINGYYLDDVGINDIRRTISVLLDEINNEMLGNTVWDNLVMPLVFLGKSDSYIKKRVSEVCSLFEIDKNILNKKMVLIDSSLRMKIKIASAIMSNPSILFLDDIFNEMSNKDKEFIIKVFNTLRNSNKMTVVMATSNVNDALYSDKVILLDRGKIVLNDSVIRVFKNRERFEKCELDLPFIVNLSNLLVDKGLISNIYFDERKLVDALWK